MIFSAVHCFQENKWKTIQMSGNNGLVGRSLYIHSHWNTMLLFKKIIYIDTERIPSLKTTESKMASVVWLYLIKLLTSIYPLGEGLEAYSSKWCQWILSGGIRGIVLSWFGFLEQTYIIFINMQNNNKMIHTRNTWTISTISKGIKFSM